MRALCLILLAGCFGAGPEPGTASLAKIIFSLPLHPLHQDNCMSGRYIGNVAIGAGDYGYVVTHTFLPACSGGTGNAGELLSADVHRFEKRGGVSMKIGEAGTTAEGGGPKPRVGASATDAVWFYGDPMSPNVHVRSQSGAISGDFTLTGANVPAAVIVDATKTYVGTWNGPTGPSNIMGPRFPCCGSSGNGNQGFNLIQLTNANPAVLSSPGPMPRFEPAQIKESLVANATNLIYFDSSPGAIAIRGFPKVGGTQFDVETLPVGGHPGGLAADDLHIAWANTVDFIANTNRNLCEITVANAGPPFAPQKLISTNKWSCTDVALDGAFVYFPIVDSFEGEGGPVIVNRGIGRIDLASGELESIELGIKGPEMSPRAVFADGDGLIVVAPFGIARIAKAELNGKREIEK